MALNIGDNAPNFTVEMIDTNGAQTTSLSDYAGKNNVVLFFYPKDDTPGCTKESSKFRDLKTDFESANTKVLGVSWDDLESHKNFIDKFDLNFPLLADVNSEITDAYEVFKAESGYMERVTYVIDSAGIIRNIWRNVVVDGHVEAVLEAVKPLS